MVTDTCYTWTSDETRASTRMQKDQIHAFKDHVVHVRVWWIMENTKINRHLIKIVFKKSTKGVSLQTVVVAWTLYGKRRRRRQWADGKEEEQEEQEEQEQEEQEQEEEWVKTSVKKVFWKSVKQITENGVKFNQPRTAKHSGAHASWRDDTWTSGDGAAHAVLKIVH